MKVIGSMSELSHIQENTEKNKRNKNHQATGSLVITAHTTLETTAHIRVVIIIQTQKTNHKPNCPYRRKHQNTQKTTAKRPQITRMSSSYESAYDSVHNCAMQYSLPAVIHHTVFKCHLETHFFNLYFNT